MGTQLRTESSMGLVSFAVLTPLTPLLPQPPIHSVLACSALASARLPSGALVPPTEGRWHAGRRNCHRALRGRGWQLQPGHKPGLRDYTGARQAPVRPGSRLTRATREPRGAERRQIQRWALGGSRHWSLQPRRASAHQAGSGGRCWKQYHAQGPPRAVRGPRAPGTITFFEELRVNHQDQEAAERGPCECPERLQELHRGVPTRPTPPKSRSEGPGAASAPRWVQPPRPPDRALHPPPTPRSAATGGATPGGDLCLLGRGRGRREGGRRGGGGRGRGG